MEDSIGIDVNHSIEIRDEVTSLGIEYGSTVF